MTITRKGKVLKQVAPGDKRRIYDGRNAYRKMTEEQRREFRSWIATFDVENAKEDVS